MQTTLYAKNKIEFIDGSIEKPYEDSSQLGTWMQCNSMVLSWMSDFVTKDIHQSVSYFETAREIWIDLQEYFSQGNAPHVYQLKRELSLLQQHDLSIAAYYTKMKTLWDGLTFYLDLPTCSCGAMKKFIEIREAEKVHEFLMGFNNYGTVRCYILNTTPLPTLGKAYLMLVQEEKKHVIGSNGISSTDAAAMAVRMNKFCIKEKNGSNRTETTRLSVNIMKSVDMRRKVASS